MLRLAIETRLNRVWYGSEQPGSLLRALERIYSRGLTRRRRKAEGRAATDLAGRPIVVVGNLTVGGTGKTPLIVRLCELLQAVGIRPGVATRGFGRQGRAPLVLAGGAEADHVAAGDEPLMIRQRTGVPVAIAAERNDAARALFAHGVDVVLADDGLQHWALPRAFEICVVDGARGFGNGRLLPAGPLREPAARLQTVDAVVVNGPDHTGLGLEGAAEMRLEPRSFIRLADERRQPVDAWRDANAHREVVAVAGIGHPQRFFDLLDTLGIRHRPRAFPDHHDYTARDFSGMENAVLVMTEKDAVKCRGLDLADAWCLPVDANLPREWEADILARIRKLMGDAT